MNNNRWARAFVMTLMCGSFAHGEAAAEDVPEILRVEGRARHELPKVYLKGRYAYSGETSCTYSPSGFDPVTLTAKGFNYVSTSSVIGIWTFLGDGTSTLTGHAVATNHSPSAASPNFTAGATLLDLQGKFTVRVFDDGTFLQEAVPDSITGKFLSGARAGFTYVVDKGTLTGFVLNNRLTLSMAGASTEIETQQLFDKDGKLVQTTPRICHASRVLTKLIR